MSAVLTPTQQEVAELYFQTGTIQFGSFSLSIHRDRPDLPKSPYYMHFPEIGSLGSDKLPQLHRTIGRGFVELCEENNYKPEKIAAIPKGANLFTRRFASHYREYPSNLLVFDKQQNGGKTSFRLHKGSVSPEEDITVTDDHMAGGRNKLIMLDTVARLGGKVTTMLVVVDRQQGGMENLANRHIRVLSLLTADTLFEYLLANSHISVETHDRIQDYRMRNEYLL